MKAAKLVTRPLVAFMASALIVMFGAAEAWAQARATVNGVVTGPTGMPQANVTVIITNAAGIDRRAVSDMMGAFVFGGLQPGAYRLRTEDDTFAPFTQDLMLAAGQTVQAPIALRPRVAANAAPTARAAIGGTVIGPDGRPRPNVTVILTNPAGIDRRAVSEMTGAYIFGGLQPGTYKLRIEDAGADARPFSVDSLPLMPGEQRQFDVRLQIVIVAPPPNQNQPRTPEERPSRQPREVSTVPEVTAPGGEFQALPNRWDFQWPTYKRYADDERQPWIVGSALDPYNQNWRKADFPILGSHTLFMNTNLQFNTALNPRQVGVGEATDQFFNNNNFVAGVELFRGDTVFQPKSWAVRGTIVGNVNDVTAAGNTVTNRTYGVEELFAEKRLAVLNTSFDFVSLRGGVQNFNSDFRGYLFFDNQLGVRLFGNARSNRDQYNFAVFSMRERDNASQLHQFDSRDQTVVVANYYIQDFMTPGYTAMFNLHINHDSKTFNDANGNPLQTGALQVTYLGFHGDGKWGAWSVSHAFYQAFGKDDDNRIARELVGNPNAAAPVDISAQMAALEVSRDADWVRYHGSLFYASGDDGSDPTKGKGFDMITDNPNLAGGAFMYWDQQKTAVNGLPIGKVLTEKFSLVPNLRSKFGDRSNFVNPGLVILNGGVDLKFSPKLKVATNVSYLKFADAAVLSKLVGPGNGFEDNSVGLDIGAAAKWRPFLNENMFIVLGFSTLTPRGGLATALGSDSRLYSFVGTIQLAY